ncbi:hypothetical protein [Streptomyces sp. NPDC059378]|uniref:hypothetical protein n=1 Tax=Streptomyces sp. NPDC059378 TaxID=3346815 RepID=UPI0036B4596F
MSEHHMKTTHPGTAGHEIRRYLAAVDQAASALSPGARARLTGGLAERIAVALAERPGEAAAVLAEFGDPYEIGADAVREAGPVEEPSPWTGPGRVVGLFTACTVLGIVDQVSPGDAVHDVLGFPVLLLMLGGIAALSLSGWWSRAQKWTAFAWLLVPNFLVIVVSALTGTTVTTEITGLGSLGVATFVVGEGIRAGLYRWLWLRRSEPAPRREPSGFPRWARFLVIAVAAVFVAVEAAVWITALLGS